MSLPGKRPSSYPRNLTIRVKHHVFSYKQPFVHVNMEYKNMLSSRIRTSFLPIQIPSSMQTKNKLSPDFNQLCYAKSHQSSLSNKKEKEKELSHKTNIKDAV